jgi:Zn-dependent oligopeptidase
MQGLKAINVQERIGEMRDPEDKEAFAELMDEIALLKFAYVENEDIRKRTYRMWFDRLSEYSLKAVREAMEAAAAQHPGFPDYAHVKEVLKGKPSGTWEYSQEFLDDLARQRRAVGERPDPCEEIRKRFEAQQQEIFQGKG